MPDSILDIVEQSLLNIATRYKEFSEKSDVLPSDLKDFDEQLNDIMDRYNKLKGLKSTYTAEELTIKLNEFTVLYDDIVSKVQNGYFNGADGQNGLDGTNGKNGIDGKNFTYDMFTPEQLALLKGEAGANGSDGQNGIDGKDFTYDMFTPEQLALLKGADGQDGTNGIDGTHGLDGDDGLSAYQIALNNGFTGSEIEWLESLKGADGQNGIDGKDFTYADFTPEQLALLKGETGANGADGTNGTNGLDGSVTFESLTPEQLALLKGEKGDIGLQGLTGQDGINGTNGLSAYQIALDNGFAGSEIQWLESLKGANGQNGIDGQSLTYDLLTTAQKDDLASHVIVSGGGSSASQSLDYSLTSNALDILHVKTNIKLNKPISLFFIYFRANGLFVHKDITFYFDPIFRSSNKDIQGELVSSSFYLSSDGCLCFWIGGADTAISLQLIQKTPIPDIKILDVSYSSDIVLRKWGVYSGSPYPSGQ